MNPIVTNADRRRGWAELELLLNNGRRRSVRVHALEQSDFIKAATLSPDAAQIQIVAQALRETPEIVGDEISPFGQLAVVQTLASLVCGERESAAMLETAAEATLRRLKGGHNG